MHKYTYTARFRDGREVTRRSAAPYTHASKRTRNVAGPGAVVVAFHTSEDAARAIAGKRGEVVAVEGEAPHVGCVVCGGARFVEYGPSATDGTMSRVPCHRCNA